MTSFQSNAITAICPATVDVLLRALSRKVQPHSDSSSFKQSDAIAIKELVLQCLVKLMHVLHASPAETVTVQVSRVNIQDPD